MIKILTIGPDYKNLKGGIASLLKTYETNNSNFMFKETYSSENNILNIFLFPIKFINILIFLIFNKNYKIIHIHGASKISFYRKYFIFIFLKYILKRKIIYHIHGGAYDKFYFTSNKVVKFFIKNMMEKSDSIICLSEYWKIYFSTTFKLKDINILNNSIEIPKKKVLNKDHNIINLLYLGKISKSKGIFDLIEVINENKEYLNNKIILTIAGDEDTPSIDNLIMKYNINHIIKFIGWVEGQKKIDLLLYNDISILPSYHEGLPITLLEAMSYKMPIIATPVGGIPEILKDDYNGITIKAGEKESIFDSIVYFIDNKSKINEYGNNSFNIINNYLPNEVNKKLLSIYKKVQENER